MPRSGNIVLYISIITDSWGGNVRSAFSKKISRPLKRLHVEKFPISTFVLLNKYPPIRLTIAAFIALILQNISATVLVTELHYHPAGQDTTDGDTFEFIELKNTGNADVDLSGFQFADGIQYLFPAGSAIAANEFIVLAANAHAFSQRYGFSPFGQYTGKLNNGGEFLLLIDTKISVVDSLTYRDESPWPTQTDGLGNSLVPVHKNRNANPSIASTWRASTKIHGSPGTDDPETTIPKILVNEVITHTDLPEVDVVELYNPNNQAVNISGWFLTDNRSMPGKFKIPQGTQIAPGGYLTYSEYDFNPDITLPTSFAFSSHGEEVYLYSADAAGNLTGYVHGTKFGELTNGVSYGRYINSIGEEHFVAQSAKTLNAANAAPRIGPIVFTEIMYHHPEGRDYLELKNISPSNVVLYDPEFPENAWKVNGIGFTFPLGSELAPGELAILVDDTISTELFRTNHSLPDSLQLFSYSGNLNNAGEKISIEKASPPFLDNDLQIVPFEIIEAVKYGIDGFWPVSADGGGLALRRLSDVKYGNDPNNWAAGPASPGQYTNIMPERTISHKRPTLRVRSDRASLHVSVELSQKRPINITLRDTGGKIIKKIFKGYLEKRPHAFSISRMGIANGVYVLHLEFLGTHTTTTQLFTIQ